MTIPSQRAKTAYEAWLELQQLQSEQPRDAPEGLIGTPTNFLPKDDPRRGTSTVIPAGTSQWEVGEHTNPFPDRSSADQRRHAQAQLARDVEAASRLSGSASVSDPRADARRGWQPKVVRDQVGRLRVDWEKVANEGGEIT